jgi:hypothetical protein
MKRLMVLAVVAVVAVLVAAPASWAQSGCEIAHECGEGQAWAMPDRQIRTSLYAWDPIFGYAHQVGAYGLVAFCQNYGGYYYLADDGGWYWNAC